MKAAILVNGIPASGKSTIAAQLVSYLTQNTVRAVPFALDTVKEALFTHIGTGDRDHNRMLGRASYESIFATIATFPDQLVPVIDAWYGFQPTIVLEDHLRMARIDHVIEVWCAVSPEMAAERYRNRAAQRSVGHLPASYADELLELARRARPLALGPVIEVDTNDIAHADTFAKVLYELNDVQRGGQAAS